jgi:hypothetical protein
MKGNEKYSGLSSRVRSGEDVDLWSICAWEERGNLVFNIINRVIGRRWWWWWLWCIANNELDDVICSRFGFGRCGGGFRSMHFIQIWKSRNGMKRRRMKGGWKLERNGQRKRQRCGRKEKDWLRQRTQLISHPCLFAYFFYTKQSLKINCSFYFYFLVKVFIF